MKYATFSYIPPPSFGCATVFLESLRKHPAKGELILFSEHDYGPDVFRLKVDPMEAVKGATTPDGKGNRFAINNLLWLTSLKMAKQKGIDYIFYLESDCRVGRAGWDEVVWTEFFNLPKPVLAAGTLAVYNPLNFSPEAGRRWQELVSRNHAHNLPISTYGWMAAGTKGGTCVFPNGAAAVYDVSAMGRYFNLDGQTVQTARENSAFDIILGQLLWREFEEKAYDMLGYLESVYSGYADLVTTEDYRMNLLREGKVVVVHAIKSNATL